MSKRKLLLADDSGTIQKVINLTFADEGIEVITTGDGDTAMQLIAEEKPDIVLADVHMSGKNGYQICESLRSDEETRHIPVILLVGSFEPFEPAEAERVGANLHMTKPFQSIRMLVSQVTDLLDAEPQFSKLHSTSEPAVETVFEPVSDEPGSDDIDELYQASLDSTLEMPAHQAEAPTYIDAGMDDEMIETTYGGELPQHSAPQPSYTEESYSPEPQHGHEAEAPEEIAAPAMEVDEPEISTANEIDREHFEDAAPFAEPVPAELLDTPSEEPEATLSQFEPPQAETDFEFDELNLLELPSEDEQKTIKFTTPEAAAEAGSSQQVVSLSPELLELIVQKVVEKLSEKY